MGEREKERMCLYPYMHAYVYFVNTHVNDRVYVIMLAIRVVVCVKYPRIR